jgi:hypothetical protein
VCEAWRVPAAIDDTTVRPSLSWALIPAVLLSGSAVLIFAFRGLSVAQTVVGYGMLAAALILAWLFDRSRRSEGLFRDLLLIAIGMVIVSTVSVEADISWGNFFLLGFVLAAAVAAPYLVSRFVFRDRVIRFPWRGGWPWSRVQWGYLALVLFLGWLILPFYFITSGVYLNWPNTVAADEIARLFVGVNAVGTWDELFFILTVFVLFKRHFPVWQANLLQMVIFVSFLWELGYQAWGPLLTIPFALLQGWIYSQTKSLPYVLTVHLLFDAVVFLVIVHARNGGVIPFFLVSP